jgi:hypothetical protein
MGWFSPVKGSYPSLAQVDKTLPVAAGAEAIKRGTIVALVEDSTGNSTEGVFKIASATDTILYVSLQDYNDPTAGFAGTSFDPKGGVPAINGIDLQQDGEYETSVFDTSKTYKVGDKLYVAGGVLTNAGSEGDTVVGVVTSPAKERWVNNAIAVPSQENGATDPRLAIRTGANLSVIRFKTAV